MQSRLCVCVCVSILWPYLLLNAPDHLPPRDVDGTRGLSDIFIVKRKLAQKHPTFRAESVNVDKSNTESRYRHTHKING